MTKAAQGNTENHVISTLYATLSRERIGTYLTAAGHDRDRALGLYMWNAQIGEAFHVLIQAVEVGIRNRINTCLCEEFGASWWDDPRLLGLLDADRTADLTLVRQRIRNRDLELTTSQIVAGLSFGFWIGILQKRYNPQIWSKRLRTAFPDLPPARSRKSLVESAQRTLHLRNRISHHEPIFREDLSKDYSTIMDLLTWICPHKAAWVRPYCHVPQLLRQKP